MKFSRQPQGELALIEQIRRSFALRAGGAVRTGIGDDCAILRPPRGAEILITTDFSLEDRHFRRELHPPESVGHRCLARGLSDLAAMGATPLAAFLSLALPPKMLATASGRRWVEGFFRGLQALSDLHAVPLAGGDTSESPGGSRARILADIVLIGSAPKGRALKRSGGRPGDALYVTGHLGGAAAELAAILRRGRRVVTASPGDDHPHLFPEPGIDAGESLLRRGLATACIDLSDGLSSDLAHLCRASRVHARIEQAALPLHPLAQKLDPASALDAALNGGEDYELLFSAPSSARLPVSLAGVPITRIGTLTRPRAKEPRMLLLTPGGEHIALEPKGWEHFSSPRRRAKRS